MTTASLPPPALAQAPREQPSMEADETELAREHEDPLAKLGSIPFQNEVDLGIGPCVGPAAAVLMQPKPWTLGVIAAQIWSVAGAANRAGVSLLSVQPFGELRFPRGWYVNTKPDVTANWSAASTRSTWTVPVGGEIGKVFLAGTLPLEVSIGGYWNAVRPVNGPSASVVMGIAFLFPH